MWWHWVWWGGVGGAKEFVVASLMGVGWGGCVAGELLEAGNGNQ